MKISEDLRRSVLQAAIQGKLTRQLKEDGSAEDLLREIQNEKEKLIAEGKIKREKILLPIKDDEIPFEIPKNWKWVRLGEIINLISGSDLTPDKYNSEGNGIIYLTGASNISNNSIIINRWTTDPQKIAKRGDVLLTCKGTVGETCILEIEEAHIARQIMSIRPIIISAKFIQIFLWHNVDTLKKQAKSMIPGIERKNVNEALIPLPPLAEQHRIVSRVDALMSKIDELEKIENELKDIKKKFPVNMRDSLLQAAIQGKLTRQLEEDGSAEDLLREIQKEKEKLIAEGKIKREKTLSPIKDDEIPFEIPENWKWERWGTISFSIQYGYNAPALQEGRIKMIRISDIQNNNIQWNSVPYCKISEEEMQNYLLVKNDILFARTGGTVGKSYLVSSMPEKAIYAGYLIRTRFSDKINPQYIKYFMDSNLYWKQLRNGTTATAQPNCNGKTLSQMIIPLPPLAEQHRIVKRLNELLPLCEAIEKII